MSLKYLATRAGSFRVQFSRDKGDTFIDYKTITITTPILNKRQTSIFKRNVRVKEFVFRIVSSAGQFTVLEFVVNGVNISDKTED